MLQLAQQGVQRGRRRARLQDSSIPPGSAQVLFPGLPISQDSKRDFSLLSFGSSIQLTIEIPTRGVSIVTQQVKDPTLFH